jgi:hypothetical protein
MLFGVEDVLLTAAVNKKVLMLFSGSSLTNFAKFVKRHGRTRKLERTSMIYFKTAGMTPAAPLVGEVTIRPPDALTSLTAIA